jgi:hypothetical protein
MEYLRQESILYFIVTPYYKERHNKAIDENVEVLKISNQSIFWKLWLVEYIRPYRTLQETG